MATIGRTIQTPQRRSLGCVMMCGDGDIGPHGWSGCLCDNEGGRLVRKRARVLQQMIRRRNLADDQLMADLDDVTPGAAEVYRRDGAVAALVYIVRCDILARALSGEERGE